MTGTARFYCFGRIFFIFHVAKVLLDSPQLFTN